MNKNNVLIISIIIILILNVILLISKELIEQGNLQINNSKDENITLSRVSDDMVTQGAVVKYLVETNKNIDYEKSNFDVMIVNSVNTIVEEAQILKSENEYFIYVDTSLLPAGIYRVMIPGDNIVFEDDTTSNQIISEESFSVILIEDKR